MKSWMPRFATQLATSAPALRSAPRIWASHASERRAARRRAAAAWSSQPESLAQALCETARDVTSASVAGLVRWNEDRTSRRRAGDLAGDRDRAGLSRHRGIDGRPACEEKLPMLFEDAHLATESEDPYGGLAARDRIGGDRAHLQRRADDRRARRRRAQAGDVGPASRRGTSASSPRWRAVRSRSCGRSRRSAVARGPIRSPVSRTAAISTSSSVAWWPRPTDLAERARWC